ncbi:hypothetical protein [Citrobacter portucalensis]|uniref:hypothetical protein n=1 Tax=Citrobacter portucalensis TaxID=1639133 RepID=UPI0018E367E6|nr:hypothetical protein [Citrobacter portucalensis]MBI1679474.1 hypothetical protein [Citrobacter portucalensis]
MKTGDVIESIHTSNRFIIEYISKDGKSFVLVYKDENNQPSRCYADHDIRRSFRKVTHEN